MKAKANDASNPSKGQAASDLVVLAMKEEGQGLFEKKGVDVLYTGIGKVNAAYVLMKALRERTLRGLTTRRVLNFGTAGSYSFKTHELVECHRFVQRDMDVSALGFKPGQTPFEDGAIEIEFEKFVDWLPAGVCGTGDSFETGPARVACDIVDMEAFALAKICKLEGLSFVSVKYVTDGSDHNAHNDWSANLPKAAEAFAKTYERLLTSSL